MTEYCVEFETEFEDDTIYDDLDGAPVVSGGHKVAGLVAAAFRRLGCETTRPEVQDIHGWFFDVSYQGRRMACQVVDIDCAAVYFRPHRYAEIETIRALLALLDRELKRDPSLSRFRWTISQEVDRIDKGSGNLAARPDPAAVLATPKAYDLPAPIEERIIGWVIGRLVRLFRLLRRKPEA